MSINIPNAETVIQQSKANTNDRVLQMKRGEVRGKVASLKRLLTAINDKHVVRAMHEDTIQAVIETAEFLRTDVVNICEEFGLDNPFAE